MPKSTLVCGYFILIGKESRHLLVAASLVFMGVDLGYNLWSIQPKVESCAGVIMCV